MRRLRRLLLTGLLLGVTTHAAIPPVILINGVLTPSARIDTAHLDGNDGTVAIPLTWAPIADVSVPCNVNYSVPLRSGYLTEAGSPTSTLSLLSGSLPTGWALNADTLDLTATGSGSSLIRIRATRLGITADTNAFNVGCVTTFTVPTVSSVTALSPTSLRITSTAVTGAGTYLTRQASTISGTYTYLPAANSPNLTVDITGLIPGTQYCFGRAAATADKSTIGPWSAGVCGTTQSVAGEIKWHPGSYIWLDPNASQATNFSVIDDISANCAYCLGVSVLMSWKSMEPTQGAYTYTNIDAYLNKLLAANNTGHRNLRFILRLKLQEYNGTGTGTYSGSYPGYLNSPTYNGGADVAPSGYKASGGLTSAIQVWNPTVIARLEALSAALAARYETNPLFEQFDPIGETALGDTWPGSTYSTGGYLTQTQNFFQVARGQWPTTGLRVQVNFVGTDAQMASYITTLGQYQVIFGGPDSLPETVGATQSNFVFRGLNYANPAPGRGTANAAFPDRRGQFAWMAEEQTYNRYNSTNAQLQTYAHDVMRMNYHMWAYQTWQATGRNEWAQVKPFIAAGSDVMYSTGCPTSYVSGCNVQ